MAPAPRHHEPAPRRAGRLRPRPGQRRGEVTVARQEQHRHRREVVRDGRRPRDRRPGAALGDEAVPVAVAASKGAVAPGRARSAARVRASRAPRAPTARSTGHGKRDSAHSVAACSPWLRTGAGARWARVTAAMSRRRGAASPPRAACSASGTPGNAGAATDSAVRTS